MQRDAGRAAKRNKIPSTLPFFIKMLIGQHWPPFEWHEYPPSWLVLLIQSSISREVSPRQQLSSSIIQHLWHSTQARAPLPSHNRRSGWPCDLSGAVTCQMTDDCPEIHFLPWEIICQRCNRNKTGVNQSQRVWPLLINMSPSEGKRGKRGLREGRDRYHTRKDGDCGRAGKLNRR